jgi:hypothetical protein
MFSALLLLSHAPAFSQSAKSNAAQAAGLSLLVLGSGGPGATGRAGAGYIVSLTASRAFWWMPVPARLSAPAKPAWIWVKSTPCC